MVSDWSGAAGHSEGGREALTHMAGVLKQGRALDTQTHTEGSGEQSATHREKTVRLRGGPVAALVTDLRNQASGHVDLSSCLHTECCEAPREVELSHSHAQKLTGIPEGCAEDTVPCQGLGIQQTA